MRLVVDANILTAELLRRRGRGLIARPALALAITERAWGEVRHELRRRTTFLEQRGRVQSDTGAELLAAALAAGETYVARELASVYAHLEAEARRRIPRDPDDWPAVALALTLGAAIWTPETLLAHLEG